MFVIVEIAPLVKIRGHYIREALHGIIQMARISSIIMIMLTMPAYTASKMVGVRPILLEGATVIDFLQRLLTNDAETLRQRAAMTSTLTDASARIVDFLDILMLDDHKAAIFGAAMPETQLLGYFSSRIFFMDQITASLSPQVFFTKSVIGHGAGGAMKDAGWEVPERNSLLKQENESGLYYSWWTRPGSVPVFQTAYLPSSPTGAPPPIAGEEHQFDFSRILLGISAAPNEIRGDFTPYEVNLGWTVSATKGCYPGQEVLARQVTYDKVVKTLVPVASNHPLENGQALLSDGKRIGELTTAYSDSDIHLALAVVRRPYNEAGRHLEVKAADQEFHVEVVEFKDDYAANLE